MKRKLQLRLILLCLAAVVGSVLFVRCSNEELTGRGEPLDDEIVNSMELEDYIVSGYDLYESLDAFKGEISKIDFSKLEFTEDSDGIRFAKLPVQTPIAEKLAVFNQKKAELQKKFPELASIKSVKKKEYLRKCVYKSAWVNSKLQEFGINVFTTRQSEAKEYTNITTSWKIAEDTLTLWLDDEEYVEVIFIIYEDGSCTIHIDSRNTENRGWFPDFTMDKNGNIYYREGNNDSRIVGLGHTHNGDAGASDLDKKNKYEGVNNYYLDPVGLHEY